MTAHACGAGLGGIAALVLTATQPATADASSIPIFATDTTCYARDYSPDHLARHLLQQVTQIALIPDADARAPERVVLRVSIMVRGDAERYSALAYRKARVGLA